MWPYLVCCVALGYVLAGCAISHGPSDVPRLVPAAEDRGMFPPYTGPKRKVQVVQINIPLDDIKRYPALSDKRIGFGLSNLLVETLFETGQFTFVEDKEQILKRFVDLWELTEDGIVVKNPVAPATALQAPEFLVYAEVFDFVGCSPVEQIGVLRKSLTCVTSVGVQVRIGNPATGEFLPGSSDPRAGEGQYLHTVHLALFGDAQLAFDQSALGKATLQATRAAMRKALQRFQQMGW